MEYLGLAGAWKKLKGFASSELEGTVFIVLGVAMVLVRAFNRPARK